MAIRTARIDGRPPRGLIITGSVMMLIGLVLTVLLGLAIFRVVAGISDAFEGRASGALGQSVDFSASSDRTAIWVTTESRGTCLVVDEEANATIVLDPPPDWTVGGTTSSGSESYEVVNVFDSEPGRVYAVTCRPMVEGTTGQFAVATVPSQLREPGRLVAAFFGGILGAILFAIGFILLIIGWVRRRRWTRDHESPSVGPISYGTPPPYGPGAAPMPPPQPFYPPAYPPGAAPPPSADQPPHGQPQSTPPTYAPPQYAEPQYGQEHWPSAGPAGHDLASPDAGDPAGMGDPGLAAEGAAALAAAPQNALPVAPQGALPAGEAAALPAGEAAALPPAGEPEASTIDPLQYPVPGAGEWETPSVPPPDDLPIPPGFE